MTARERLPNRRQCESLEIFHSGVNFTVSAERAGTPLEAIARDAAILASIAFQHGVDLETIRAALTKDHDGGPATAIGAALDKLGEAP
jgi:hypothetical protein